MGMDEQGWVVETWDDDKGIRFSKGPCSAAISIDLLIPGGDKAYALEAMTGEKLEDLFRPQEGLDGEDNHVMWWTLMDIKNLRILVKRLQAMLDTEEESQGQV